MHSTLSAAKVVFLLTLGLFPWLKLGLWDFLILRNVYYLQVKVAHTMLFLAGHSKVNVELDLNQKDQTKLLKQNKKSPWKNKMCKFAKILVPKKIYLFCFFENVSFFFFLQFSLLLVDQSFAVSLSYIF